MAFSLPRSLLSPKLESRIGAHVVSFNTSLKDFSPPRREPATRTRQDQMVQTTNAVSKTSCGTRTPRRRAATSTKTVKATISSRERGRQYRQRLKLYQKQLHGDVALLRKHVRGLQLLATLQKRLSACTKRTTTAVMKRVRDVLDGQACEPSRSSSETPRHGGGLRFVVDSCTVVTPTNTPVVVLRGWRRGVLNHDVIHRLYFCVPGNTALLDAWLDREVTFPSTRIMTFAADGQLLHEQDETDYATALAPFTQNAWGWSEMLRVLLASSPTHDTEAQAAVQPA